MTDQYNDAASASADSAGMASFQEANQVYLPTSSLEQPLRSPIAKPRYEAYDESSGKAAKYVSDIFGDLRSSGNSLKFFAIPAKSVK